MALPDRDGQDSSSPKPTADADARVAVAEPVSARDVVAALFGASHRLCLESDRLLGSTVGLSEARGRLLLRVSELEPARMGRLADDLGVTARSVTTMVDALEREGLLTRAPDPEDRRATLLRLTADGWARIGRLHQAQHTMAEKLLAPLSRDEQAELLRMLTRLRDSLGPDRPGR